MTYEEIPDFDRTTVLEELNSGNSDRIIKALLSTVLSGDDYDFSLEQITKFSGHYNEYVRGCAVECLGHLSRLYTAKLDEQLVTRIINAGKQDGSDWVRRKTNDAVDDLELFERKK